jgi:hypothetical protein
MRNHWITTSRLRKLQEWQKDNAFQPLADAIRELSRLFPNDKIKLANRDDQIIILIGDDLCTSV